MITNLKIRIKNYKSYLDSGWISLDGKIILTGVDTRGRSNGVGKSSILESLNLFLTEEYVDWSKADITSVINNNASKKDKLEIIVNCLIDNKEFTGTISGRDHLIFEGDNYLYNKFKQELVGSVMTQGLVDNIADFEKRSELDNYIDRFYNTKEIVNKLTDFKTTTINEFNASLDELKNNHSDINNQISQETSIIARLQGFLDSNKENIGDSEETLKNALNSLYSEYDSINVNYDLFRNTYNNKIKELKKENDKSISIQTLNKIKLEKDFKSKQYIQNKKQDFLNKLDKVIKNAKDEEYSNNLKSLYTNSLTKELLIKINDIKGTKFLVGTTGKEVIEQLDKDKNEISKLLGTTIKYSDIDLKPYTSDAKTDKYLYYKDLEDKIELIYSLPKFLETAIKNSNLLNYDWSPLDTSNYDTLIKQGESQLTKDNTLEINSLNEKINNLNSQELRFKELGYKIKEVESTLDRLNKVKQYTLEIESHKAKLDTLNFQLNVYADNIQLISNRLNNFNNLIGSIIKYSGEELRKEFGTKLGHLATILVNDIFGFKGEIALDSNASKTAFKFDEGNGFLSFKRLSGGQLQKIKLAINLAMLLYFYKDRQYIFLDEVFQHLDPSSKEDLIDYIVNKLNIKNILLIQHEDLDFAGFKELKIYRDENNNTRI